MRRKFSEGLLDEEKIIEALGIGPGQTVLDAGCGNGYMAKRFSERVGPAGSVIALDTDRPFIETLKTQVADSNIVALAGDITRKTELAAASLDLAYLSTVFHIFTAGQIQGFITEVWRISKPGGRLAIVNIKKEEIVFGPPVEMKVSAAELRQLLPFAPAGLFEVGEHFYMQVFDVL